MIGYYIEDIEETKNIVNNGLIITAKEQQSGRKLKVVINSSMSVESVKLTEWDEDNWQDNVCELTELENGFIAESILNNISKCKVCNCLTFYKSETCNNHRDVALTKIKVDRLKLIEALDHLRKAEIEVAYIRAYAGYIYFCEAKQAPNNTLAFARVKSPINEGHHKETPSLRLTITEELPFCNWMSETVELIGDHNYSKTSDFTKIVGDSTEEYTQYYYDYDCNQHRMVSTTQMLNEFYNGTTFSEKCNEFCVALKDLHTLSKKNERNFSESRAVWFGIHRNKLLYVNRITNKVCSVFTFRNSIHQSTPMTLHYYYLNSINTILNELDNISEFGIIPNVQKVYNTVGSVNAVTLLCENRDKGVLLFFEEDVNKRFYDVKLIELLGLESSLVVSKSNSLYATKSTLSTGDAVYSIFKQLGFSEIPKTILEINRRYRKLVKIFHPDDLSKLELSEDFTRLTEAKEKCIEYMQAIGIAK